MPHLAEAPEAVRDRFGAWEAAKVEANQTDESRFALAMSGFVVGIEGAVADLEAASTFWKARDLVRDYLASRDAAARAYLLGRLEALHRPGSGLSGRRGPDLDTPSRLAAGWPRRSPRSSETTGQPILHRVRDDENVEPTEYSVLLPPEYHPFAAIRRSSRPTGAKGRARRWPGGRRRPDGAATS